MSRSRIFKSALVGTVAALALAGSAFGQARSFDVPAGDLKAALDAYIRQAGVQLFYRSEDVRGKSTRGVHGALAPDAALEQLLAGSGVIATRDRSGAIVVAKPPQGEAGASPASEASQSEEPTQLGEIVVTTGSRIRGAPPSSPVIRLSQEDMRNAGQANLGDLARALPQNFNGGQSPGIGVGAPAPNENVNSATNLNLRGLGQDATLTLLNGRRMPYDSALQGVDISSIPIAAVDRIEILTDGASALYGSDAVGGVANVILKRDYEGVTASARYGGSTEGGNEQQQFTLVGGRVWGSGGLIATADVAHTSDVTASQRDYTSGQPGEITLYPQMKHWSALVSTHQDIGRTITASLDALYSNRSMRRTTPYTTSADYLTSGVATHAGAESFVVAPSVDVKLPGDWRLNLSATYGKDRTANQGVYYTNGAVTLNQTVHYINKARVLEGNVEGGVLSLPGGQARLAAGAGYRDNTLESLRDTVGRPSTGFTEGRDSYYVYGELFLPLVSPNQAVGGVQSLSFTAAARYENYPGMDSVTTPKLGIVYGPTPDFDLRISWGKSFKAPTLQQQFSVQNALLYRASQLGAVGQPATATAIYYYGGNPDLGPERADSITTSLAFHPRALPGARLELSYFHIDYRDRLVVPVTSTSGALTNPLYVDLVTLNPSDAMINSIIAASASFTNASGSPFDINNVVAVLDNRNRNATEQTIRGYDASAGYRWNLTGGSSLSVDASASYLESVQTLIPGQSETKLAGLIFNPPHFRARAGVVWEAHPFTLATFVNHIGGVKDNRFQPIANVDGQTTVDLTGRYRFDTSSRLNGFEFSLSVLNAFDAKPDLIKTAAAYYTNYDSTNYSAIGRFVGLTVSRSW